MQRRRSTPRFPGKHCHFRSQGALPQHGRRNRFPADVQRAWGDILRQHGGPMLAIGMFWGFAIMLSFGKHLKFRGVDGPVASLRSPGSSTPPASSRRRGPRSIAARARRAERRVQGPHTPSLGVTGGVSTVGCDWQGARARPPPTRSRSFALLLFLSQNSVPQTAEPDGATADSGPSLRHRGPRSEHVRSRRALAWASPSPSKAIHLCI